MKRIMLSGLLCLGIGAAVMTFGGCSKSERAVGGVLAGGALGATVGGVAGGGTGAAIGGPVGAIVGGLIGGSTGD